MIEIPFLNIKHRLQKYILVNDAYFSRLQGNTPLETAHIDRIWKIPHKILHLHIIGVKVKKRS